MQEAIDMEGVWMYKIVEKWTLGLRRAGWRFGVGNSVRLQIFHDSSDIKDRYIAHMLR